MAEAIDWTKPLELLDGTPVRLSAGSEVAAMFGGTNPDHDGHYWVRREDGEPIDGLDHVCLAPDGDEWVGLAQVRNRAAGKAA